MKGLNVEGKDYDYEELLNDSKVITASICPSSKRSIIQKEKKKYNQTININILSKFNNFDLSKLSKESPEKIHNSLQSYYLNMKNKNIPNKENNKKLNSPKKKPFDSKNKNLKINNINNINRNLLNNTLEIIEIKDFNSFYEIPFHGKYDFLFLLRGGLSKNEWFEKTKNIRKYPLYLKNTLFFQSQIKLKEIHNQNFDKIYQIYTNIRKRGIHLYKNKKYRECIENFNYAYGIFRWIEFKDKNFKINSINSEIFTILDEDIEEKKVIIDQNNNNKEENLYKSCLIYILEIMAYCHIELRLYSNAIECLDECASLAGNNFPDVYLRRAQARICNKKISDGELKIAEKDINRAINLVLKNNSNIQKKNDKTSITKIINPEIYFKTKNKYNQIIQKRLEIKVNNIRKILGKNLNYKNELIFDNNNDNILYINSQNIDRQYKILKEIKKKYNIAVKFFTETKNQLQLDLTYKEYESFYDIFKQFKFFYKFSVNSLDKKVIEQLNDNEKKKLFDSKNQKIIEKNKNIICENIFINGNYNAELYKYVVDKILEEEKNEFEKNSKMNKLQNILNLNNGKYFIFKIFLCFIIVSFVSVGFQIYYLKHFRGGLTDIDK